ncbi:MAG: SOS response-associated peptidase [Ilumatobacteraceae bacterium]
MCGRFVSATAPDRIAKYFGAESSVETLGANFNVAPTNDIYGIVDEGAEVLELQVFHWGLVPVWAKERKIGQRMINARSETLADKAAFKADFRKHRCIIPMDGFYEWAAGVEGGPVTKAGKLAKRPHFIQRVDSEPLAVAGLWSMWRDRTEGPDARWLHSATVVTTAANATMATIHDRMPVILPRAMWPMWLDPENHNIEMLQKLLVPARDDLLAMRAVSIDVNNVRNNGPHLIAPA